MQKLMQKLKSKRGSTLVGAVVLCAIMGIGVAGLMGVTRNTLSQEADAHDDTRAFLAAEAGLLMLTDWLAREVQQAVQQSRNVNIGPDFRSPDIPINGVNVRVAISRPASLNLAPTQWLLSSTADIAELGYTKTIEWVANVAVQQRVVEPADFGAVVAMSVGRAVMNQNFDGPVHFNAPMIIDNVKSGKSGISFNGPVTVYNPNDVGGGQTRISAPRNLRDENGRNILDENGNPITYVNDYTYGVTTSNGGALSLSDLNSVFQNTYSSDGKYMRVTIDQAITRVHLPVNTNQGATNTLTFGVNSEDGRPFYTLNSGERQYYNRDDKLILHSSANLTVTHGKMLGNVTVETAIGRDLTINISGGHLTYDWISFADGDFDKSTDRLLKQATDRFHDLAKAGDHKDVLAFYSGNDIIIRGNQNQGRALTAQLFAVTMDNNGNPRNTTFKSFDHNQSAISVVGTVSANTYWITDAKDEVFTGHFHDERQLAAPGMMIVDEHGNKIVDQIVIGDIGEGGEGSVARLAWTERNTPR